MAFVSSLFVYPIKACAAVAVDRIEFDALGPRGDRRYMLVSEAGDFLSQRSHPELGRVVVRPDSGRPTSALQVQAPGMSRLRIAGALGGEIGVRIWDFEGHAAAVGAEPDAWFSDYLGERVRLVAVSERTRRRVDPRYDASESQLGFADGYPILLTSEASLDELSQRAGQPIEMGRFRPNIVVSDCAAGAEDEWRRIRVGGQLLDVVKPCQRCSVTAVDPLTLQRGKEPLKTLASYRRRSRGVYFGQNCLPRTLAPVHVGDEVLPESVVSRPG